MGIKAVLASFGGDVHRSWKCVALWPWPAVVYGYPKHKFSFLDYRFFMSKLKPGDFLLTTSEPYFLSNFAIKSKFKHLAVYTGPVKGFRDPFTQQIRKPRSMGIDHPTGVISDLKKTHHRTITHAISEGVVCEDVGNLLFHSDYVAVVRPWMDDSQQKIIVEESLRQVGLEYDFQFDARTPSSFYCTELGLYCCHKAAITPPDYEKISMSFWSIVLPFDPFKAKVVLADAFVKAFPVIATSVSCGEPEFLRGKRHADFRIKMNAALDAND